MYHQLGAAGPISTKNANMGNMMQGVPMVKGDQHNSRSHKQVAGNSQTRGAQRHPSVSNSQ